MSHPATESHLHWRFIAFNGEIVNGQIALGATVEVVGFANEEDARIGAADVVKRDRYLLQMVWECRQCGFQAQTADYLRKMAEEGA